jgi:alkanesulfonate monooxygenase SsuD/methylene tetrahydromethanopterin reductase-like flavin-dependent oxidoreductase (luciferase family)
MIIRENDEPLSLAAYAIMNESGDQARNYHDAVELFRQAEQLGVEGLWVRQVHLRRPGHRSQAAEAGGLPSPLVFLGWLAARTSRLRLGTAAVTLPLESPLRLAEDAAVLDALSGGRVELGVANGGSGPGLAELFRSYATAMDRAPGGGIGAASRRVAYRASLTRLADALDGVGLGAAGHKLNPPSLGLTSRIWEIAASDQSGYDVGARGNGVLIRTGQTAPAEVTARSYYRGLNRRAAEFGARTPRVGISTLIYPAGDRQSALREVRDGIEERYEQGSRFLPAASTLAEKAAAIGLHYGTPEQIAESILSQPWFPYATQLMVQTDAFFQSYAQRADALELFVRAVAPALGWVDTSRALSLG